MNVTISEAIEKLKNLPQEKQERIIMLIEEEYEAQSPKPDFKESDEAEKYKYKNKSFATALKYQIDFGIPDLSEHPDIFTGRGVKK